MKERGKWRCWKGSEGEKNEDEGKKASREDGSVERKGKGEG